MKRESTPVPRLTSYDLFMAAITVLSIVNLVLYLFIRTGPLRITIEVINVGLSVLFLIDFFRLLYRASDKRRYFFREFGWADLLSSIPQPQFNIFRIFRLVRIIGFARREGSRRILREFRQNIASAAVLFVFFIIILLLEFGSVGILAVEGNDPAANIHTASDALWWVYVTITTVGYGDKYPVTNDGRLLGAFVMLVGVGLFGVVTGFLANKFLPKAKQDSSQEAIEKLQDEIGEIKTLLEMQIKSRK